MANAARLTLLFLGLGILATRAGVIVHEYAGHAVAAWGLGAGIDGGSISLFGGAWVGYRWPLAGWQGLLLDLSGILANMLLGAALLAAAGRLRTGGLPRMLLVCTAGFSVLGGGIYLVRGLHYGYGDGRYVHLLLDAPARGALTAAIGFALVAATTALALAFFRQVRAWLPHAGRGRTLLLVLLCGGTAAGIHGALLFAENALQPDRTYAAIMTHEAAIQAQAAVARDLAARAAAGQPAPAPAVVERLVQAEERRRAPFPLDAVLFPGLALAVLAGGLASGPVPGGPGLPGWRAAWRLLACAGAVLAAILLLRVW